MHTGKSSIHPKTPEIVLKSVFKRYDSDGDGNLSQIEFTNALENLGIIEEMEQKALFALADANNNKKIKYNDFVKLIKSNDLDSILSSPQDYQFVIETYTAFQQYDGNCDGEVTWSEFYFYLSKHGYSHETISQYWYYMDQNKKLTISFEGFWKGYKIQHAQQAIKAHKLQKEINKQIMNSNQKKKEKKKFCQTFNRPSFFELVDNNSWDQNDKNNIFNYALRNLSPVKHLKNVSPYVAKKGRVLNISNRPRMVDVNSNSSVDSQSQCSRFNFIDYNMDYSHDDIDIESICSSISVSNTRKSTSLFLIESKSLEVTMSDSFAVVPALHVVNENINRTNSKKQNCKMKKHKNKNKKIKHKKIKSDEY